MTLVASFESEEDARAAMSELPPAWGAALEEVVGDAWRDEWKKHFEPFAVCPGVVVRPPWREHEAAPGERVIVLEPGRAFGTGLHETTSLVAEVLAGETLEGKDVLDVGCGSGILALVALALGAARARAIDVDPDAVAVTRENAERNAVEDRVDGRRDARRGDRRALPGRAGEHRGDDARRPGAGTARARRAREASSSSAASSRRTSPPRRSRTCVAPTRSLKEEERAPARASGSRS